MIQDVSQQALPVMHLSRLDDTGRVTAGASYNACLSLDDAGRVTAGASCNACLSLDDTGRVTAGASCNASFPSG